MVGLSDIPLLGNIVSSLSSATVEAMYRGLRYTFRYKALVNDFESEMKKLNAEAERVSVRVNEETDSGRTIYDSVLEWQGNVDEIRNKANQISVSWKCIPCLPIPNPVARFQLGKEAVVKKSNAAELVARGRGLQDNEIAHRPRMQNEPNTESILPIYPSLKDAYEELWNILVDKDGPVIVGIHGMAGVGKTTMMKRLWIEAMAQGVFNKVTQADVRSQNPLDVINLQQQIAGHLNCRLELKDDAMLRANQLRSSLKKGGKTLIVLDDVWRKIRLEDIIGTSLADAKSWKGYKILFICRERSACLDNDCKRVVEITALTGPESWDLFEKTVGAADIENLNDKKLAEEVCKKCAGLPLVIRAVARQLRSASHHVWTDTLNTFQTNIASVPGISGDVFASLKLSVDNQDQDVKKFLLVCSLFSSRGAHISKKRLILLAAGSQHVPGGITRILAMIDILKSSSLSHKDNQHLRLIDIFRDVAVSVAVTGDAFLRASCGSLFADAAADYSSRRLIHLDVDKDDDQLPDRLVCSHLRTLLIQGQYKIGVPKFKSSMFENLKFLVLIGIFVQTRFSLRFLLRLQTLYLDDCDLRNTNSRFYPTRLKTLCIWDCNLPTFLELPNMILLRKLEIRKRYKFQMGRGTISRLLGLEKLYLEYPSEYWDDSMQSVMPSFKEISSLKCLTSLKIFWDSFEPKQDTTIFSSLVDYDIRVGGGGKNKYRPASKVSLTKLVELADGNNFEGFRNLIGRAEEVILRKTNVDISNIWNGEGEVFKDLKNLYIDGCKTMKHLAARIAPYEIPLVTDQHQTSFSNLSILKIERCSAMKYLLSHSVAKGLKQLQHLSVSECGLMEVIVLNDGTSGDGEILNFKGLISLKLLDMHRLTSFYGGHSSLLSPLDDDTNPSSQSQPQPQSQPRPLFNGMVAFPCLEELELSDLKEISDIWGEHYPSDNVRASWPLKSLEVTRCHELDVVIPHFMLNSLSSLERLELDDCDGLRNVFLPSVARGLGDLKKLEVMCCKKMTAIIGQGEQSTDHAIIFHELTHLKLNHLQELSIFSCQEVKFPKLVDLILRDVKINLEEIELGRYDSTCELKYLDINCDSEIQLPDTWQLCLHYMQSLALRQSWSEELKIMRFWNLKVLKVFESGCSILFTFSVLGNLHQLQELEISKCCLLEEVVEDVRGDEPSGTNKEAITLFRMKSIVLKDLPKLKSFFSSAHFEFYTPALERLEVVNCEMFTTLFTCPVSKRLEQLQSLHVYNCRSLECVVEDARGTETLNADDRIIRLSGLSEVVLTDLPNLKSFSLTVRYTFLMPKLHIFRLFKCPHVENFTPSRTSVMVTVNSEWHKPKEVLDLNDFVRQYRKRCDSVEDQPLQAAFLSLPWSSPWAC
ncbi:hypothetical protein ACET3Z_011504 [Daucus carota]